MSQSKKSKTDVNDSPAGGVKFSLKDADLPSLSASAVEGLASKAMVGGINPGRSTVNQSQSSVEIEPEVKLDLSRPPAPPSLNNASTSQKPRPQVSAPRHEVSCIKGLSDHTNFDLAAATEIGHAMTRPSRSYGRVFKWALFAVLMGAVGYVAYDEKLRVTAISKFKSGKEMAIAYVRYQPKQRYKNSQKNLSAKGPRKAAVSSPVIANAKTVGRRSCQALISEAIGANKVAVSDRVAMAECYLMIDDYEAAEESLKPLRGQLASTLDNTLNSSSAARKLGDAYVTLAVVYAIQGKYREASDLMRGKCPRWEVSNTCAARALVTAMRNGTGSANISPALFQRSGGIDRKMQARLWWAGAMLAEKEGKNSTIDQRFGLALKTVPPESVALKKMIFESYAVSLYKRGDMIRLNTVVKRAIEELARVDRKARLKLEILRDLATSNGAPAKVRSLLASDAVTYRARNDFELVEILGAAAIRSRQFDRFLNLAKKSRAYFASKHYQSHPHDRALQQWEVRMIIGKGDYETALTSLASYEAKLGKDLFLSHMRGVTYHLMSPDPQYQRQAAQEFQSALRTRRNWESLYAVGVTLLRAGRAAEAATVIKDLEQIINSRGQKYWLEMLKAEWYIAKEKYLNAEKILTDWSRAEIEYVTPRQLLVSLYHAQKRSSEVIKIESELSEINRNKEFVSSFEGLSSPLGVMAHGDRPIN